MASIGAVANLAGSFRAILGKGMYRGGAWTGATTRHDKNTVLDLHIGKRGLVMRGRLHIQRGERSALSRLHGGTAAVVDQHDGNRSNHPGNADRKEILLKRQLHRDQQPNQHRCDDGAKTANTRGEANARRPNRAGIELASVCVSEQLRAKRRCTDDEHQQEEQLGRLRVSHEGERHRPRCVEGHQYMLDVEPVTQPATTNGAAHRTDVEHQHEGWNPENRAVSATFCTSISFFIVSSIRDGQVIVVNASVMRVPGRENR